MDAARAAKRMNSKKVYILYRRNRELMPARDIEIEETKNDGVEIIYNTKVLKADTDGKKLTKITCIKTKLEEDKIIDIENSEYEMNVDTVVFAIGLKPKRNLPITFEEGLAKIDEDGKTNIDGVFAGGDLTEKKSTVCRAISSGKRAAEGIHKYLQS